MEISGSQTIAASNAKVWAFLLDVNNVASCAPGFQSLEELGPEHWKALVSVSVGPVKAKFTLDVTRPEIQELDHMVVKASGKSPVGVAEMSGEMQLFPLEDEQTRMDWKAIVVVSGTIASVGARMMQGTVNKLTGQFFDCLNSKIVAS
jgi:uncharacterized protein